MAFFVYYILPRKKIKDLTKMFFIYLNVLGWMWQLWQPSANYKGSKDTLRPDLQANT
jgi:hypothetical protein